MRKVLRTVSAKLFTGAVCDAVPKILSADPLNRNLLIVESKINFHTSRNRLVSPIGLTHSHASSSRPTNHRIGIFLLVVLLIGMVNVVLSLSRSTHNDLSHCTTVTQGVRQIPFITQAIVQAPVRA